MEYPIGIDREIYFNTKITLWIKINPLILNNGLITGNSGSGKTTAIKCILNNYLKYYKESLIFILDFKNSEDFKFLDGYPHYYSGKNVLQGVSDFYSIFSVARDEGKLPIQQCLLVFDEYPAFINYLTTQDKINKTHDASKVMTQIAEVLMMGRGLRFGTCFIVQRPDSSLFPNGSRDNFQWILSLGRLSKEHKQMLFSGYDLPEEVYQKGEGVLYRDGYDIRFVKMPYNKNIKNWEKRFGEKLIESQLHSEDL